MATDVTCASCAACRRQSHAPLRVAIARCSGLVVTLRLNWIVEVRQARRNRPAIVVRLQGTENDLQMTANWTETTPTAITVTSGPTNQRIQDLGLTSRGSTDRWGLAAKCESKTFKGAQLLFCDTVVTVDHIYNYPIY